MYPETELHGDPLGANSLDVDCERCEELDQLPRAAVVLADGMKLCADCAETLKAQFEEIALREVG